MLSQNFFQTLIERFILMLLFGRVCFFYSSRSKPVKFHFRYRRMTVATQLIEECVKRADGENYHRISIICTDAFSEKIVKKLKFEAQGDPLHYKKFVHPTTGSVIYKCIYKKPHKKMVHYTMRF